MQLTQASYAALNPTDYRESPLDLYHIALFIHIVTVIVAAAVAAIVKLAATHRIRACPVGGVVALGGVIGLMMGARQGPSRAPSRSAAQSAGDRAAMSS